MTRETRAGVRKIVRKLRTYMVFAIVVTIVIVIYCHVYPVEKLTTETKIVGKKVIERNLEKAYWFLDELPEPLPEMAWKGNVPSFIKDDLAKVRDEGWTLKYTYGSQTITIYASYSEFGDELYFYMYAGDSGSQWVYGFKDLALYKFDDKLYWYAWTDRGFENLVVSKFGSTVKNCSSNPKDVPLKVDDSSSVKVGDYVLVRDGTSFSIWKNGRLQNSKDFTEGEIAYVSYEYSILATSDNKLYGISMYITRDTDYKPDVYFNFIGTVDEASVLQYARSDRELTYTFPRRCTYSFPIFEKSGEYYAVLPVDIKGFASYSLANKGEVCMYHADTSVRQSLVKLSEKNFFSAEFSYKFYGESLADSICCWQADIRFENDGTYYLYSDYPIFGYDRHYYLTDEEEESLTRSVFSVEEFWEEVSAIRKAYENYYERPGG